ncbi:MAG TPA: hypothetical protein EYH12_01750 [Psychromonas hadalis]|nr:hypothetical protein [Psychromonas hadalis]
MKEELFNYCNNNLRDFNLTGLKKTASLERLNQNYGFGTIDDKFCYFNDGDRARLIDQAQAELAVHLFRDAYPAPQSRTENAQQYRNEK